MKKALLFLAALCVAGFFSAKAQSASDSAYVRDLNYTAISTTALPVTVSDTLGDTNTKILLDVRSGRRAKGFVFTVASATDIEILMSSLDRWDSYLYLLDGNFRQIAYNDDFGGSSGNGSRIFQHLEPGRYYIIAAEYTYSTDTRGFSIDLKANTWATLSTLNCVSINATDTVTDSLVYSDRYITDHHQDYIPFAKGYRIQTPANAEYIEINIDAAFDDYLYLLDKNRNVITYTDYSSITSLVNPSSTYYIVASSYSDGEVGNFELTTACYTTIPTYYVDGVNGSDDSTGLTPATAFRTLEAAVSASSLNGDDNAKFYLTDDYTFTGDQTIDFPFYAKVFPYQRDIRLHMPTSGSSDLMSSDYQLFFGENGSSYNFIIDSSTSTAYDELFEVYSSGTYLEINNLKVRNSMIPSNVGYVYNLVMNNCEFTNDSIYESFFELEYNYTSAYIENTTISQCYFDNFLYFEDDYAKLTMKNSTISQCTIDDYLIFFYDEYSTANFDSCTITQTNAYYFLYYYDYYSSLTLKNTDITHNSAPYLFYPYYYFTFTMDNSNWTDNSTDNTIWFELSEANLISGSWRNNTLSIPYDYNTNTNLTADNWAGLCLWDGGIVTFGSAFSMDTINLIIFDSTSSVYLSDDITVPHAATLYPYFYDDSIRNDFYIGHQVIFGDSTLLANNFRKFKVAQVDTVMWYIHEDGKIYNDPVPEPEPPVAINGAEEGTISLYPNPANNVLNIALQGSDVNEVVVIDIYGKTVARTTVAEGNNALNISALPAGMYFVQLRANNSVKATQKIVKR